MMERIVKLSQILTIRQESIYADRRPAEQKALTYQLRYVPFTGPEPFRRRDIASMRDFNQRFFDWFKKPVGTLPQAVQQELSAAFEETKNPDQLRQKSQTILRNHKLVR